jgi:hypothetical protein
MKKAKTAKKATKEALLKKKEKKLCFLFLTKAKSPLRSGRASHPASGSSLDFKPSRRIAIPILF